MTECWPNLDPRRASRSLRIAVGRTLNAMMIAFDADASSTSDSFYGADTGVDDADLHLLVVSFSERVASTSADPCTSA